MPLEEGAGRTAGATDNDLHAATRTVSTASAKAMSADFFVEWCMKGMIGALTVGDHVGSGPRSHVEEERKRVVFVAGEVHNVLSCGFRVASCNRMKKTIPFFLWAAACNTPQRANVAAETPVPVSADASPLSAVQGQVPDAAPVATPVDASVAQRDLGMIGLLISHPSDGGPVRVVWSDPNINVKAWTVDGRLPPEHILSVIAQNAQLRTCYGIGLRDTPTLAGRVVLHFVIGRNGDVSRADSRQSTLPDADVPACMVSEIKKLHFAQPEGDVVTVTLPLELTPP